MGIDIYLHWDNQSEDEHNAQVTGFKVDQGDKGYLREAYHGSPYATKVLFTENWEEQERGENPGIVITNKVLLSRLKDAVTTCIVREQTLYGTNKTTDIINLDNEKAMEHALASMLDIFKHQIPPLIPSGNPYASMEIDHSKPVSLISAQSFIDFVTLHGEKEKEGKNPRVYISY